MSVSIQSDQSKSSFGRYLANGYWYVFGREWPAWFGGILIGLLNFALFTYAAPIYIYNGFLNWGQWLYKITGIVPSFNPAVPWLYTGSVQNAAIFIGAFIAIMASSNFRPRMPARKIRLLEGFVGGLIMGVGAILAPGCNIGGFFSAMSGLSLSGFVLFFGLAGGSIAGVWLVKWRVKREISKGVFSKAYEVKPGGAVSAEKSRSKWRQPLLAIGALIIIIALAELLITAGHTNVAVYMLFGLAFGIVLQRSGFCMTASFRDLFTSGSGRLARGAIVAIVVSMFGAAILYGAGVRQPYVLPLGWHTLVGGFIFGFGMVIAGGCATGTLFRIGEGNVQYLMALLGALISAPLFNQLLTSSGFTFGTPLSLVPELGIQGALLAGLAFVAVWLIIVQWNEARSRK